MDDEKFQSILSNLQFDSDPDPSMAANITDWN